jgi:hypothetical protein
MMSRPKTPDARLFGHLPAHFESFFGPFCRFVSPQPDSDQQRKKQLISIGQSVDGGAYMTVDALLSH